jgi:hypothetical protein
MTIPPHHELVLGDLQTARPNEDQQFVDYVIKDIRFHYPVGSTVPSASRDIGRPHGRRR